MSGLDQNLDLSFLLGEYLPLVAFGLYDVHLCFGRVKIIVFNHCEVRTPDKQTWKWESGRENDMTMFRKLLDSEIESYKVVPGHELVIRFTNGCELTLTEGHDGHESFSFRFEDRSFIII